MSCPKSCQDKHDDHVKDISCIQRKLDAKISRKGTIAFVFSLVSILTIFFTFGYSQYSRGENKIMAKSETHTIAIVKITTQLGNFQKNLDEVQKKVTDIQKTQVDMLKNQFTKEELASIVRAALKPRKIINEDW